MGASGYPPIIVDDEGQDKIRYVVPLIVNNHKWWGLVDTGAPVTVLFYSTAQRIGIDPSQLSPDGEDTFVGGFPFPYAEEEYDVRILPPNVHAVDDFFPIILEDHVSLDDYYQEDTLPELTVTSVPFRIILEPIAELARQADWDHPELHRPVGKPLPVILLGVYRFLDQIEFSVHGGRSCSIFQLDQE